MGAHCVTCTCVVMSDEEYDALDAAEKAGTEPSHVHCPDCGCNPDDHTEHAEGCRRCGQGAALQCTRPDGSWNPWPDEREAGL